jgi:hypothetical protein
VARGIAHCSVTRCSIGRDNDTTAFASSDNCSRIHRPRRIPFRSPRRGVEPPSSSANPSLFRTPRSAPLFLSAFSVPPIPQPNARRQTNIHRRPCASTTPGAAPRFPTSHRSSSQRATVDDLSTPPVTSPHCPTSSPTRDPGPNSPRATAPSAPPRITRVPRRPSPSITQVRVRPVARVERPAAQSLDLHALILMHRQPCFKPPVGQQCVTKGDFIVIGPWRPQTPHRLPLLSEGADGSTSSNGRHDPAILGRLVRARHPHPPAKPSLLRRLRAFAAARPNPLACSERKRLPTKYPALVLEQSTRILYEEFSRCRNTSRFPPCVRSLLFLARTPNRTASPAGT